MRWTVKQGDVLERLREMPDASVQCVVTSPPYWGLRDYGTAKWEGGEAGCDHKGTVLQSLKSTLQDHGEDGRSPYLNAQGTPFRSTCGKCGARRIDAQLGLEPTPDAYVAKMVEVFREVRRVLRDDGTLWLNLGDSYAANRSYQVPSTKGGPKHSPAQGDSQNNAVPEGLKPKDLVGIPWRVAFALQADGWYLRSDIIWAKPNPMPESVTDRPTKSHEYVFLLTKSARYFFDAEAVKEPATKPRRAGANSRANVDRDPVHGTSKQDAVGSRRYAGFNERYDFENPPTGRNIRSVWTIATQPFPEAHFATYPEELVERCIKAGSREYGPRCDCAVLIESPAGDGGPTDDPTRHTGRAGMNRERRADEGTRPITRGEQRAFAEQIRRSPHREAMAVAAGPAFDHYVRTDASGARPAPETLLAEWIAAGWLKPPAECSHPMEYDLILDPFTGSGTTGAVSIALGRSFVGVELNPAYVQMARKRIGNVAPLIAEEVA